MISVIKSFKAEMPQCIVLRKQKKSSLCVINILLLASSVTFVGNGAERRRVQNTELQQNREQCPGSLENV